MQLITLKIGYFKSAHTDKTLIKKKDKLISEMTEEILL